VALQNLMNSEIVELASDSSSEGLLSNKLVFEIATL
jgi:hypothetical protein